MSVLPTESVGPDLDFAQLPLSPELREAIEELGYDSPTPVQQAVFEPATSGIDLVVQARTGTGKTAAFGMPIVDHLVRRSLPQVQALVLCPTAAGLPLPFARVLPVQNSWPAPNRSSFRKPLPGPAGGGGGD